ncbi:hypothetical protein C7W93_06170 [Glaciimonas sp. PCH181]|nr:hypothetical protein C7W93_06170 [Glaciimonas sp. PCH181]
MLFIAKSHFDFKNEYLLGVIWVLVVVNKTVCSPWLQAGGGLAAGAGHFVLASTRHPRRKRNQKEGDRKDVALRGPTFFSHLALALSETDRRGIAALEILRQQA